MCPHGYHHNGFMTTPALETQDVRLHIVGEDCIVECLINKTYREVSLAYTQHIYCPDN